MGATRRAVTQSLAEEDFRCNFNYIQSTFGMKSVTSTAKPFCGAKTWLVSCKGATLHHLSARLDDGSYQTRHRIAK